MSDIDEAGKTLPKILEQFPEDSAAIARLYFSNEVFRGLCEDFCLAHATLASFEDRPDASTRIEIGEYRSILKELAAEIRDALTKASP